MATFIRSRRFHRLVCVVSVLALIGTNAFATAYNSGTITVINDLGYTATTVNAGTIDWNGQLDNAFSICGSIASGSQCSGGAGNYLGEIAGCLSQTGWNCRYIFVTWKDPQNATHTGTQQLSPGCTTGTPLTFYLSGNAPPPQKTICAKITNVSQSVKQYVARYKGNVIQTSQKIAPGNFWQVCVTDTDPGTLALYELDTYYNPDGSVAGTKEIPIASFAANDPGWTSGTSATPAQIMDGTPYGGAGQYTDADGKPIDFGNATDPATDTTLKKGFNGLYALIDGKLQQVVDGSAAQSAALGQLKANSDTANSTLSGIKSDTAQIAANTSATKTSVDALGSKLDAANTKQDAANSKADTANTTLAAMSGKLDTVNTAASGTKASVDAGNAKLDTANSTLSGIKSDTAAMRTDFSAANSDIHSSKLTLDAIYSHEQQIESYNHDMNVSLGSIGNNLANLRNDITVTEGAKLDGINTRLDSGNTKLDGVNSRLDTANGWLSQIKSELTAGNVLSQSSLNYLQSIGLATTSISDGISLVHVDLQGLNTLLTAANTKHDTGNNYLSQIAANTLATRNSVNGLGDKLDDANAWLSQLDTDLLNGQEQMDLANDKLEAIRTNTEQANDYLKQIAENTAHTNTPNPNDLANGMNAQGQAAASQGSGFYDSAAGYYGAAGSGAVASDSSDWEVEASVPYYGTVRWDLNPLHRPWVADAAAWCRRAVMFLATVTYLVLCWSILQENIRAANQARQVQGRGAEAAGFDLANIAVGLVLAGIITVAIWAILNYAQTALLSSTYASRIADNPFGASGIMAKSVTLADAFFPLAALTSYALGALTFRLAVGKLYWIASTVIRFLIG